MKRSYLEVIAEIREAVGGRERIMLMNSLGYSSLSLMPSYDGTFSEGRCVFIPLYWPPNYKLCTSNSMSEPTSHLSKLAAWVAIAHFHKA